MSVSMDEVWNILSEIYDPEIPSLSLVDMGIIRAVGQTEDGILVTITPTFAACPAIHVIKQSIIDRLQAAGAARVEVRLVMSPAWSTDRLTPRGRQQLREFGIAPPPRHTGDFEDLLSQAAACPYCGSTDTELKNDFGSTLCRSIHFCHHCRQPFESFKPI